MKKLVIFFLIFLSFSSLVNAVQCNYQAEIDDCANAVKNGNALGISNFVCINDTNAEKRAYQIVLDKKFKEVDDEARKYLDDLEKSKDNYFGENKKEDINEWIDKIEKFFWEYWYLWIKYNTLCSWQILKETIDCLWWSTTIIEWKEFLKNDWSDCMWLVSTKLGIYKQVSYDILKLNKEQVRADARKTFVQKERTSYDLLSDLFSVNLWYLERLWMKTPTMISRPKKGP